MSTEKDPLPFEAAYAELEKIVERMERGEQSLEASLADFERGVGLMRRCHEVLGEAEQQIEILMKNGAVPLSETPGDESTSE